MKILGRYILKEYLKNFVKIFLSFVVIFLIIDVFDRLPRLLSKGAELFEVIQYFLLRIPYLLLLTSPVIVLLSALFLMNTLAKYNESIAIRAAGISIKKMVKPLIIWGFIYSLIALLIGEFVFPKAEEYRKYVYKVKIKGSSIRDLKRRSDIYFIGEDHLLYNIEYFDGYKNILKNIDITEFNEKNGSVLRKIKATSAKWQNDSWQFKNCTIRNFSNNELLNSEFYKLKKMENISPKPIDFIRTHKEPDKMSFFELKSYIDRLKKIGDDYNKELVELFIKISFPFVNFIIIFFSFPLSSTGNRDKSRGIIFFSGIAVCFIYIMFFRLFQSLGYSGLVKPIWAATIPNIIFGLIGLFFYFKAEK